MERQTVIRRLLDKRQICGNCWLWQGGKQSGDNYGKISIDGKTRYVHRVSAYLWLGMPLDSPRVVRHLCISNPNCFNPSHLKAGTRLENNRDIVSQGRHSNNRLADCDVTRLIAKVRSGKQSIGKWAVINKVAYRTAYAAYHGISHKQIAALRHSIWNERQGSTKLDPILNRKADSRIIVPKGCVEVDSSIVLVDSGKIEVAKEIDLIESITSDLPF